MRIGILGSGVVARTLGSGLLEHGHTVRLGTRHPDGLAEWAQASAGGAVGTFAEAAEHGELLVLAVKGTAALDALRLAGEANLAGKVVLDATNPIADAPPEDGVLRFFTGPNESLMERLQAELPRARFVKAFNSVGAARMVDPHYEEGRPSMFLCGDDAAAKETVSALARELGWEPEDMGGAAAARAIEPLCMLWCIPGFRQGEWSHAFKLLHVS